MKLMTFQKSIEINQKLYRINFFSLKSQEEVLANLVVTVTLLFAEQPYESVCCPLAVRYSTLHHTAEDPQDSLHYLLKSLFLPLLSLFFTTTTTTAIIVMMLYF